MRTYLAILAFLASGMLFSAVCVADRDGAPVLQLASDVNSVDQSTQATDSPGVMDWLEDHLKDSALSSLFGDSAEPIEQDLNLYSGAHQLDNSDAFSAITQSSPSINTEDPSEDSGDGGAAENQFWNGTVQNDAINIVPGGGTFESAVQNAQALYDKGAATVSDVENDASQVMTKVNSYLYGTSDYGLQPGSSDAQAAQQAVDASGAPLTVDVSELPPDEASGAAESAPAEESAPSGQQAVVPNESANISAAPAANTSVNSGAVPGNSAESGTATTPEHYPTIPPISMTSSDPNSCIRTSDSLGVPSVSIDCGSGSSTDSAEQIQSALSAAEAHAEPGSTNIHSTSSSGNLPPSPSVNPASGSSLVANALLQALLSHMQPQTSSNVSGEAACAATGVGSGVQRCQSTVTGAVGICDMARTTISCLQNSAIPSCGSCGPCVQEARTLIASLRAEEVVCQ